VWYGVRGSTPPSNIASSNPLILVDPKNIEGTVSILQSNPKGYVISVQLAYLREEPVKVV